MLPTVSLKPLHHKGKENIALCYSYHKALEDIIKRIKEVRFSTTHNQWYLPLSKQHYLLLQAALKDQATIDNSALKHYLEQRKAQVPALNKITKAKAELLLLHPLSDANLQAFTRFQQLLVLKGYSPNTFRTYSGEFQYLLRLLGSVCVSDLTKQHVQSYLLWLIKTKGYSEAHVHTAVNAIKFYFESVEKRGKEFYDLPRPKKVHLLPDILEEEEIVTLIQSIENLKHRALIMMSYSAGLRVSELVHLQIRDIDSRRMMIHVRQGKGKKDRMVPLSKKLLETLRIYYKQYQPKQYLFEGEKGGAYSSRSAQEVLARAKVKARIKKKGSIHSLRHSYATHLLESGIDIRYIQAFLGHNNIKTTLRYTHVTQKKIATIQSPLDKLSW